MEENSRRQKERKITKKEKRMIAKALEKKRLDQ